jgi:MFS family permease
LACAGFGILPFGSSYAFCIFAMLIFTSGEMLALPVSSGFVANRSPRGSESLYMGWYTVMQSTGSVLGPMIGSWIYQVHRDALWLIGLAVGVFVCTAFQFLALWTRTTTTDGLPETPASPLDAAVLSAVETSETVGNPL